MVSRKSDNLPLVSVIIPTYNNQNEITRAINSVLNQSYKNFELVIVDDSSTDLTPVIISEFALRDSRIKMLSTPFQSGLPSKPRNLGASYATGKYLAFLDSDDFWTKNKLFRQINFLEKNEDLGLTFSPLWQFSKKNLFLGFLYARRPYFLRVSYQNLLKENMIQCSSVIMKSNIFRRLGGFDESLDLKAIEDFDLWLRAAKITQIRGLYLFLGFYRIDPESISNQESIDIKMQALKKRHPNLYVKQKNVIYRALIRIFNLPIMILFSTFNFLSYKMKFTLNC